MQAVRMPLSFNERILFFSWLLLSITVRSQYPGPNRPPLEMGRKGGMIILIMNRNLQFIWYVPSMIGLINPPLGKTLEASGRGFLLSLTGHSYRTHSMSSKNAQAHQELSCRIFFNLINGSMDNEILSLGKWIGTIVKMFSNFNLLRTS